MTTFKADWNLPQNLSNFASTINYEGSVYIAGGSSTSVSG